MELQSIASELAKQGVIPFAISYDSVATLGEFAQRNGIGYSLLADEGSQTIKRLGMLDEDLYAHHAAMGGTVRDDQRGVCYPGVFLLDEQGIVRQRRIQRNYRVRESGASLLEQALGVAPPLSGAEATAERQRVRVAAHVDSPTYWRYQRLNLVVELDIEPGCHIYAPPTREYTALSIELAGEGLEAGPPDWPRASRLPSDGLDEELWVYEGKVRVSVPFEFIIQRGEPMGDRALEVMVRWQACSDSTCWPPEEARLQFMVRERAGVE